MNEYPMRQGHSRVTAEPVEKNLDEPNYWREFLRLPKVGGRCPVTGLSRATLNELILGPNPPVKSVVLRKRGKTRGIRLIETESLIAYLRNLPKSGGNLESGGALK